MWEFPLQLYNHQDRLEHATEVLVKIADYGTSRISTLHGIKSTILTGTPGYMAPELFSHQGQEISPDKVITRFCTYIFYYVDIKSCLHTSACTGPEPTVRPVRFWPDHFFLGAHPLLVNAWDWHLQRNR